MVNSKVVHACRTSYNINYGIHGADFMKMDVVNLAAVDTGLRRCKQMKYGQGLFLNRFGQFAFFDQVPDGLPGSVVTFFG